MHLKELKIEVQHSVAVITMINPNKLNPFTIEMGQELTQAIDECERNDIVRFIILTTGSGGAFCVGGDIKGMSECQDQGSRKVAFFK